MSAFLHSPLPARNVHRSTNFLTHVKASQFEQFEQRDEKNRELQLDQLKAVPKRARYHHVFLNSTSSKPFRTAAERFFESQSAQPHSRLWLVQQVADDTFGTIRGIPSPPRVMLIEDVDTGAEESNASRWIAALDRAAHALSPMESHFVDYVVQGSTGDKGALCEHEMFASEILNADWSRTAATSEMRIKLLQYAERVGNGPHCRLYEVLQSVDEPSCFKTVEVYTSMDALREHMKNVDPLFAKDMLDCRAAVNRVRQLYCRLNSL